jgi:hypothetical protein
MLITNFAAGELAETLFGRTDLGQYYSGVSRLENFDVIPTGGISRRHGMKRIPVRDTEGNPVTMGEGRIIPFIVDREKSFLLFLEPGSISILDSDGVMLDRKESVIHPVSYGADNAFTPQEEGNTTLADIADPEDGKFAEVAADETRYFLTAKYEYHADGEEWTLAEDFLLYDAEATGQVQYAQNFRTMILVHPRFRPVVAEIHRQDEGYRISVVPFVPKFGVKVNAVNMDDEELPAMLDETYTGSGYLSGPYDWPGSVTFFAGRLVFAATGNNRQRIFASRSGDIYDFSTWQCFLTKQKNYMTVRGTIGTTSGGITTRKDTVFLDDDTVLDLAGDIAGYYVDSPAFPVKDGEIPKVVQLIKMEKDELVISQEAEIEELSAAEAAARAEMNAVWSASNTEAKKLAVTVLYFTDKLHDSWGTQIIGKKYYLQFFIDVKYCRWKINGKDYGGYFALPDTVAKGLTVETVRYWLNVFVNQIAEYFVTQKKMVMLQVYTDVIEYAAQVWYWRIITTMRFNLHGRMRYDTAPNLDRLIERVTGNWTSVYIALYTETVIEDRHAVPDDGFTFEIASDMSDAIKWLAQNKNLLAGTETGEWVIPAGVNATSVQAFLNSRYGSDGMQATSVGDAVCFFQTGKKALVEYYIPQEDSNFRANNMATLSQNMLHESPAFDFDFISAPYTKIFVAREDGVVACLLYERGTGTFAWGRITTGKEIAIVEDGRTVRTRTGLIKSVATIPGQAGYDDVYFIVKRGEAFFLERHSERIREGQEGDGAVFLDSYRRWNGDAAGYSDDAVVYDGTDNKTYPVTQAPIPDHVMWIGYPYESRVRSMPVLANDRMKQNNIKNLLIRFGDSFMPKVRSLSMEEGKERPGHTDSIGRPEPYSGVVKIPFPGTWDRDVFFELVHDRPTRCRVLAVNAEVN